MAQKGSPKPIHRPPPQHLAGAVGRWDSFRRVGAKSLALGGGLVVAVVKRWVGWVLKVMVVSSASV